LEQLWPAPSGAKDLLIISIGGGGIFDKISVLMPRLPLKFILPPLLLSLRPCVCAQLPGPVAEPDIQVSTASLLEQLAYIPDYSISLASAASQAVTEEDVVDLEEGEESDADIFISSALSHTPEPVNLGGNGRLTLTRNDNGEKLTVRYRNPDGSYDAEALARLDHLMRCSLTGREIRMSVKLIELLDAVEDKFGKKGLTLLSGYRTAKNNRQTAGAVRHSLHLLGWAADIKVPGYSSTRIKKYGRKLWIGGVGYYPNKGFTHLDVGRPRYWAVSRPPHRRRIRRSAARTAARKTPVRRGSAVRTAKTAAKPGLLKRKS
jgi:uncharacterized protein YcbK (DUF882 family)